ncbi:uncharacterized protein N7498_009232 [Penicillium cinerascens]|uniref:Uncharacterized protein n=1 Tax=Penicillium cinerascens TaxID=70096 RepID=A0A9W9J5J7_9EURO|nr:uncharacterized protein N7498_009232 [Penicillium cinerascens]KAJ5190247.1 hypothetical protein N7498_009232 [Penicillium cinerascens]
MKIRIEVYIHVRRDFAVQLAPLLFADTTILFRSRTLTGQPVCPNSTAPLRYLNSMSILSIHPAAVFYPQPNLGFGPPVVSRKRWSQIPHLTISSKLPDNRSKPIWSLGSRAIPKATEVTLRGRWSS